MKTNLQLHLLFLALLCLPGLARAQGTAIGYQGQLNDGGLPVTGLYDFTFNVFDVEADGVALAATVVLDAVPVTNGLFNVALEFGPDIFTGPARWLEITVRTNGVGDPSVLAPRTRLLPTPYSIFAGQAGGVANGTVTADQLNTGGVPPTPGQFLSYDGGNFVWSDPGVVVGNVWSLNGTDAYYNNGNVGIGTTSPTPGIRLEVNGAALWTPGGTGGAIQFGTPNFETGMTIAGAARADLRFDGSTLKLVAGPAGGPPSSANGIAIDTSGNVGIGTASPSPGIRLEVNGAALWTPGGTGGAIQFGTPNFETGMTIKGDNRADVRFDGSTLKLVAAPGGGPPPSTHGIAITTAGNVGIGTTTPQERLSILDFSGGSSSGLNITGVGADGVGMAIQSIGPGGHKWALVSGGIVNPVVPSIAGNFRIMDETANATRLVITPDGNVGIGAHANPQTKLHVEASGAAETTIKSASERAILSLDSTLGGQNRVWTLESGLFGTPGLFGIYDRTAGRARLTIDSAGVVGTDVLQIRGGADLSEHFDVQAASEQSNDATLGAVEPGMVVCIDQDNPGKLIVSSRAYDRRVAGIMSGAGGVKPGMVMSQAGSVADGAHPVALTGRVYCFVDASHGPVAPGDLLTTSDTAGHAMKVTDHGKAQGAILGKAMSCLKEGKGLVLVLVTLQ